MTSFAEQIAAFSAKTKARIVLCYRASAQDLGQQVIEPVEAGGHMPVRTGFLRSTFLASTQAMPVIDPSAHPPKDAAPGQFAATDVNLVIAGADLDETIYMGFVAAYARRVNYGFVGSDSLGRVYGQWGYNFIDLATQQWPRIVDDNAKKAIAAYP
jgi:hypothetical protein